MSTAAILVESPRLYLRAVQPSDAEGNYVKWMNDPEVVRFLESRFRPHSVVSLRNYIEDVAASPDNVFCAIVQKEDGRHIGNVKLGPIDWNHLRGEVGLMIGERDAWGKGYATEAFKLIARHGFCNLNLNKVTAGAYVANVGSIRAMVKVGFVQEGLRRCHYRIDGSYTDLAIFGILREDFMRQELPREAIVQDIEKSALV
jgi:[ribosomal protein S5]-alanine N-acetyltransferase